MGLSASQARLLALTSRQHDIEYKAQNLEAQKLQMSNESDQVYGEYENALNKQKIQIKTVNITDGSVGYSDITAPKMSDANYAYEVTNSGKIYSALQLPNAVQEITKAATIPTISDFSGTLTNLIDGGYIVLVKLPKALPTGYTGGDTTMAGLLQTDSTKSDYYTTGAGAYTTSAETNIATDTNFQEVSDDTDLKKAEAKYESDMSKINAKDKKFDTDIASLDTERTAVKTEIDTLKTDAKDNVDRTFKLFS